MARLIDIFVSAILTCVVIYSPCLAWTVPIEYGLKVSDDGHHFQQTDGTPFFWQADTAWLLFHRLNFSECEIYLNDRAAKGFNMVLAVGFTQIGIDSPNRNGDLPFVNEDLNEPNELYWEFIDSIVQRAWEKGIRIALVPAWGQYVHSSTNVGSVINSTTALPFGRFIGQRYPYLPKLLVADTNPWWTNKTAVKADYASGGVVPTYNFTNWGDIYGQLAEGIVAGEQAATPTMSEKNESNRWIPLITIHPTNQWFAGGPLALASAFFGDTSWLTFDASQSGHADFPPNPPIPWWNARRGWEPVELMYNVGETSLGNKRPAIDNEAHYEGRYDNGNSALPYWNASNVRTGSWQSAFCGAAGITYGANNVMQMTTPGLFPSDGSGPSRSWEDDINLPGSGQIQYIRKAILDRGNSTYFSNIPAQDIINGDAGSNDERITAMRDRSGLWIMVYTPTGKPFAIETNSLAGCNVISSWYDPLTGNYSTFDYEQCKNGTNSIRMFTPPSDSEHSDWVLVLEAENKS